MTEYILLEKNTSDNQLIRSWSFDINNFPLYKYFYDEYDLFCEMINDGAIHQFESKFLSYCLNPYGDTDKINNIVKLLMEKYADNDDIIEIIKLYNKKK